MDADTCHTSTSVYSTSDGRHLGGACRSVPGRCVGKRRVADVRGPGKDALDCDSDQLEGASGGDSRDWNTRIRGVSAEQGPNVVINPWRRGDCLWCGFQWVSAHGFVSASLR